MWLTLATVQNYSEEERRDIESECKCDLQTPEYQRRKDSRESHDKYVLCE